MPSTGVVIAETDPTMADSASPVSPTRSTPAPTFSDEVEISDLLSLAASDERVSSACSSGATPAKPRPASDTSRSGPTYGSRRRLTK